MNGALRKLMSVAAFLRGQNSSNRGMSSTGSRPAR